MVGTSLDKTGLSTTSHLYSQRLACMRVLDEADLFEGVSTGGLDRELRVGQLQAVDVLDGQEDEGVEQNEGRTHEGDSTLLGHHPDDAGDEQEDKGEPAVVGDAPQLEQTQTDLTRFN